MTDFTTDEMERSVDLALADRDYGAVVALLSLDRTPRSTRQRAARAIANEADAALTWAMRALGEDPDERSRLWEARDLVRDVREDLR